MNGNNNMNNNIMNNNINSQVGNSMMNGNVMNGNNVINPNYNQNVNIPPQNPQPSNNVSDSMTKEEINAEISKINAERNKIAGDLQQALNYLQERGIGLNDKIEDIDEDEDEEDYDNFGTTDDLEVETDSTDNFIEESDEPQNFDIF